MRCNTTKFNINKSDRTQSPSVVLRVERRNKLGPGERPLNRNPTEILSLGVVMCVCSKLTLGKRDRELPSPSTRNICGGIEEAELVHFDW